MYQLYLYHTAKYFILLLQHSNSRWISMNLPDVIHQSSGTFFLETWKSCHQWSSSGYSQNLRWKDKDKSCILLRGIYQWSILAYHPLIKMYSKYFMRLPMLLCGAQVVVDIEYNSSTATRASGLTGNTDWRGLPGHHEQVSKPRALLGITSPSHNPDPLATSQRCWQWTGGIRRHFDFPKYLI